MPLSTGSVKYDALAAGSAWGDYRCREPGLPGSLTGTRGSGGRGETTRRSISMNSTEMGVTSFFFVLSLFGTGLAQVAGSGPVPVTVDSFPRAESDMYFASAVKDAGGLGKFFHNRAPADIDHQMVIRMNRDTLYSSAVFDLDAAPVTITLPDSGKRLMSLEVISEDHYAPMVVYAPSQVTLTKDNVGTRYVMAAVRTLADPNDPEDLKQVAALQDAIKVDQTSPGTFEPTNWNTQQQKEIRDALLGLSKYSGDFSNAMGPRGTVDPIGHLIVTAAGWGANPDEDASYASVTPAQNDGTTTFALKVPANVPVDGFWSITVYNDKGFLEKNDLGAYSLNNITAKKNDDGSVDVQFGGCDGKIANCLPITDGWNYTVRMYRPQQAILDGTWKFPEAQPVPMAAKGG
jgi:hypothetical protein